MRIFHRWKTDYRLPAGVVGFEGAFRKCLGWLNGMSVASPQQVEPLPIRFDVALATKGQTMAVAAIGRGSSQNAAELRFAKIDPIAFKVIDFLPIAMT